MYLYSYQICLSDSSIFHKVVKASWHASRVDADPLRPPSCGQRLAISPVAVHPPEIKGQSNPQAEVQFSHVTQQK